MKLNTIKQSLIIVFLCLFISCETEEDNTLIITGFAKYIESKSIAKNIPLKLTIYNSDSRQIGSPGKEVLTDKKLTDKEGYYAFSFDRSLLPANIYYKLSLETDTIVITGGVQITPGCRPVDYAGSRISERIITKDLNIDYPTYFKVMFIKSDHSTTDRVRLMYNEFCGLFESTLLQPDTSIVEKVHLFSFKPTDLKYLILKDNGVTENYQINNFDLLKNDTTKLVINY
jgi:hypothetical protein